MKRFSTVTALAVAVTGSAVVAMQSDAAVLRYRASGDWTEVTDGATPGWGPNPVGVGASVPGAGDEARINFGNNTVEVTSIVPDTARVLMGVDESGNLVIKNGGSLTATNDVRAGNNGAAAVGTLTVEDGGFLSVGTQLWSATGGSSGNIDIQSGGLVTVASHLWLGVTGASVIDVAGTLDQTGGILGLGTSDAVSAGGGTAILNILDGGTVALNNISSAAGLPSIQAGSLLTITGDGQLLLPGDFEGVLNDYVDAGKIVGIGGDVVVDQNLNPGFTTAYIPEPGSVMLLGTGVLALLARRKQA
jgi:hypothetical protein